MVINGDMNRAMELKCPVNDYIMLKRLFLIAVNICYVKATWYAQSNILHFALLIGVQCVCLTWYFCQ